MKPITPFNVRRLRAGMLVCLLQASALTAAATDRAGPGALATVTARAMGGTDMAGFEGVVEAVRQTAIASQVSGAVLHPAVKAGDRVKAGQLLVRLDARAAEQSAAAGAAQANAARAELDVARSELARQRTLLGKQYISQAAFDRAEARFKAADAQVAAQLAEAGAARTQSGFYVLSAPYAGIIADVAIVQGDMAMPGRALMTLYDPLAMRITAPIPQSAVARLSGAAALGSVRVELPALAGANSSRTPTAITVLPMADPATHTVAVRFDLSASLGLAPGMFARVWLPMASAGDARIQVPARSIVRRAEVTALYVVDASGRPQLRQVRLGRVTGDMVEVMAGVADGERVAADPQAAARVR